MRGENAPFASLLGVGNHQHEIAQYRRVDDADRGPALVASEFHVVAPDLWNDTAAAIHPGSLVCQDGKFVLERVHDPILASRRARARHGFARRVPTTGPG